MWHGQGRRVILIGVRYENLSVGDHLEDLDVQEMKILKWTFKK